MSELAQEITRELLTRLEPLSLRRLELEEQIARSQEEMRRIDAVFQAIGSNGSVPKTRKKPQGKKQKASRNGKSPWGADAEANAAKRVELVRTYLNDHKDELADGFTGAELARQVSLTLPSISPERMREVLPALAEEGLIYIDRRVRGGGNLYKFILSEQSLDETLRDRVLA